MKSPPKNYDEYIQAHQQLLRDHEGRYATCAAMCNDLWDDEIARENLKRMQALCREFKKSTQLTREEFEATPESYLWRATQDNPTDINRFKRQERAIKKEHLEHGAPDSKYMRELLAMFKALNHRSETEWLPGLRREIKNKNWPAATNIALDSPFFPMLFGNNFDSYCELKLKKLCARIPGNENLLKDYERIYNQGLEYYHQIPRQIKMDMALARQEKILAQEKPAALAAAAKYLEEQSAETNSRDWVDNLLTGMKQAIAPQLSRAQEAQRNIRHIERLIRDYAAQERQ